MSPTTSHDPATLLLPAGSFIAPAPIEPAPLLTGPEFVSPSHDETLDTRLDAEAKRMRAETATPAPGSELTMLEARSISAWFGDHKVLDRVSLTMEAGKITALIGPSGCGKSTFLRILNRMHEMIPSASLAGEVLLDGEDIYAATRRLTDARRDIGMVFQKPNPSRRCRSTTM